MRSCVYSRLSLSLCVFCIYMTDGCLAEHRLLRSRKGIQCLVFAFGLRWLTDFSLCCCSRLHQNTRTKLHRNVSRLRPRDFKFTASACPSIMLPSRFVRSSPLPSPTGTPPRSRSVPTDASRRRPSFPPVTASKSTTLPPTPGRRPPGLQNTSPSGPTFPFRRSGRTSSCCPATTPFGT